MKGYWRQYSLTVEWRNLLCLMWGQGKSQSMTSAAQSHKQDILVGKVTCNFGNKTPVKEFGLIRVVRILKTPHKHKMKLIRSLTTGSGLQVYMYNLLILYIWRSKANNSRWIVLILPYLRLLYIDTGVRFFTYFLLNVDGLQKTWKNKWWVL